MDRKQRAQYNNGLDKTIYTCSRCGISGDITEINREGQLHYNTDLHCFDRKSCERRIRKNKK